MLAILLTSIFIGCGDKDAGDTAAEEVLDDTQVAEDADTCEPGETFDADDGCNTCECPESGLRSEAACTEADCDSGESEESEESEEETEESEETEEGGGEE